MNSDDVERDPLLATNQPGSIKPQFFGALSAAFGGFSLGTVLAYTSPALPSLKESETFGDLTLEQVSWVASLAPLASLVACATIGIFTERIGRKGTIISLTLPLLLGWILIGTATNVWMLYIGRILSGYAGGAYSVVVPIYINETALESVRGRLGLINTIAIPSGMCFLYVAGCFLPYNYLALLMCVVPITIFSLMLTVAESPRYYLCRGKVLKAAQALTLLRGTDDIYTELEVMKLTINNKDEDDLGFFSMLTNRSVLKPMGICIGLMFFLVASGIDALIFYSQEIFIDTGAHISPSLSTVAVGVIELVGIFLSLFFIDRFGRRPLMIISELTMATCLGVLGMFFHLSKNDPHLIDTFGWVPLATLAIFGMGFTFGMGSVPYVYLEVIPSHVAGRASGIAVCFNWSVAFIVTRFFRELTVEIGSDGTFWLFSGFCCVGACYIYFCVPETKGKTLEEIRTLFK